jgi:hypothetical protein
MEFLFPQTYIGFDTLHIPAHAGNPVLNWGESFRVLTAGDLPFMKNI